ncbi:MAG: transporter [Chloroflexi bacterium]|nr:transporter [Chloroflexota bacterium]
MTSQQKLVTPSRQVYNSRMVLLLLCSTQFIVVLDTTVVNIALPAIQHALNFSTQNLQWVANAYLLMFAGFLLLGGRVADVMGRRKLFIFGIILFSLASLAAGFGISDIQLIAARVVQGIAAAIISPAALSILTVTFPQGKEHDRALGTFGAMSGIGAVAGLLLGGILTQFLGWQWVFLINIPVGVVVAVLSLIYLEKSPGLDNDQGFDLLGALSVTAALVLLVYTLVQTAEQGWTSLVTLGSFGATIVLMALFVVIELKSPAPMVDFTIFRYRRLTVANLVSLFFAACIGSTLFLITLYMQQVLGYSALEAGLALLPFEVATIFAATISARAVTRLGVRRVVPVSLTIFMVGLLLLSRLETGSSYLTGLLPGTFLFGLGLTGSGIPLTIAAVSGVPHSKAGLASGLINTMQQVGISVGLAIVATLAAAITAGASPLTNHSQALVSGFQVGFLTAAGFAGTGAILALVLFRNEKPTPDPLQGPGPE